MECSIRKGACWRSLLLATVLTPGAALAADNGFYLGLGTSDVSSNYELGGLVGSEAEDERGFKGIVGFRPLDSFALEANYVDFGETIAPLSVSLPCIGCPTTAQIDSQAVSVSAVALLALPLVDLFARVGYARWESEMEIIASQETEGSDPTYGAGIQFRVGSFALRAEYERFDFDDDDADLLSVGFTYTFL